MWINITIVLTFPFWHDYILDRVWLQWPAFNLGSLLIPPILRPDLHLKNVWQSFCCPTDSGSQYGLNQRHKVGRWLNRQRKDRESVDKERGYGDCGTRCHQIPQISWLVTAHTAAHCPLHTEHCIMYVHTEHWTLNTTHWTLHTVCAHYPLHTEYCTPYAAHWTLQTVRCTLNAAYWTLNTVRWALNTAHSKLHTEHYTLINAHCTLHFVCCTLQTTWSKMHTACWTLQIKLRPLCCAP